MAEQEQRIINPDSITTRVMEQRLPSRSGLQRKHLVSVAQTVEGEQYLQIGSARHVTFFVDVDERTPATPTPSVSDIVRLQYDHPADSMLREIGMQEVGIDQLRERVQDGQDLVEGAFVVFSRPGSPSIQVPGVKGVWAPAEKALGEDWHLV